MPKARARKGSWFRHIKIKRTSSKLAAIDPATLWKPRPVFLVYRMGKRAVIGGVPTRLYSIKDLTTLFRGPRQYSVMRWYWKGVLPPPFVLRPIGQTGRNASYWTTGQVRAILMVYNDMVGQGVKLVTFSRKKHVHMMWAGSERAKELFLDRIARKKHNTGIGSVSIRGVEWVDDPRVYNPPPNSGSEPVYWDPTVKVVQENALVPE